MLQAQLQFIKQLYRVSLLGKIHIHFIYDYDPKRKAGQKLNIYIVFSGNEDDQSYYLKLRKIVNSSSISTYFQFQEIQNLSFLKLKYSSMAFLRKKERIIQTVIDNEEKYFYLMKLSITLDTLPARILKLSSDSHSRIESAPFYSRRDTADR